MQENDIIRKTAGLPSGKYTVEQVKEKFGIDASQYPKLLKVWKSELVSRTLYAMETYERLKAQTRNNWHALGVSC
jgi:hypothetical protein